MRLISRSCFLLKTLVFGLAATASAFGGVIDISTGTGNAPWQVLVPVLGFVPATSLATAQQNGTWAPPPTGSNWVSFGSDQGTSCVIGQTAGNGCASALLNPGGDTWEYALNISAAQLGATSGTLNFLFGADDSVNLFVGGGPGATSEIGQLWNQGPGLGAFADLGCSAVAGPTNGGNTQASYATCTTALTFDPSFLNTDGSLTIDAFVFNAPIIGCPACGDASGFVLSGEITTGASAAPEPRTFLLVALAGLAGYTANQRRKIASLKLRLSPIRPVSRY
jgi:hypothetical protein